MTGERYTLLEWKEGTRGTEHKITVMENDEAWLVMKQEKRHNKWKVEESWHSEEKPEL